MSRDIFKYDVKFIQMLRVNNGLTDLNLSNNDLRETGVIERMCVGGVVERGCHTLQHTATHCNTLQHTATHCNNGWVIERECVCGVIEKEMSHVTCGRVMCVCVRVCVCLNECVCRE